MAFTVDNINNNSTENRNSRYVQGGLTDIYKNRLGWWEKREIKHQDNDIVFTILSHEESRPDSISQRFYGKPIYAWLVLQYNSIVDPETELKVGTTLRLPSQQRLILDIISKPEGGKPVT